MKKGIMLGVISLGIIALSACSSENTAEERVVSKTIYGENTTGDVIEVGNTNLLFKAGSKIPYIELGEGVELLSYIRKERLKSDNYYYKMESSQDGVTITNDRNAKCIINKSTQKITYDDYDLFTSNITSDKDPLGVSDLDDNPKYIKLVTSNYEKGKEVTIDLSKYSSLDIYEKDNKYYLPLSVYNTLFYNKEENMNLSYNQSDLYTIPPSGLVTSILGMPVITELGEKYYKDGEKQELTADYYEYSYQSLCFDFDIGYGLKDKFTSFDAFLSEKGFKNDVKSTNIKTSDKALSAALSHLVDGHTSFIDFSCFYEYGTGEIDEGKINTTKSNWMNDNENYIKKRNQARQEANVNLGLYYGSETAFVTFNEFTEVDDDLLYGTEVEDNALSNTGYLFKELYKDLTVGEYQDTVKNIVIDLSANDGGSSNGLIYALSVLIGEVKMDVTNPLSGAHKSQTYKADMNADGVIDENDVSLYDKGFNIIFLDSKYTFSSANAMAVYAKTNKPDIVTIGQKTGGGPCAVRKVVSAYGSTYSKSSLTALTKKVNGNYVNIDGGVEADYELTEDQMVSYRYIVDNISSWKSKVA